MLRHLVAGLVAAAALPLVAFAQPATCPAHVLVVSPLPLSAAASVALHAASGRPDGLTVILTTDPDVVTRIQAALGVAPADRPVVLAIETPARDVRRFAHQPDLAVMSLTRADAADQALVAALIDASCRGDLPSYEETVLVTGSRVERDVRSVPFAVSILDDRAVARSGADSAGELLRDVPGVQLTDTSLAGGKRIRIRGEVGSNVMVLVDGREISEQRSFHGSPSLLVDLGDVERVEIVRGPSSVAYGSKAIGGTVNFIPRKPAATPLSGRVSIGSNSATAGVDASASVSGTIRMFDYRLSAARADHGDRRVPESVVDNAAYTGAVGRLENSAYDSTYLTSELGVRVGRSRLAFRAEDFTSSNESHTSNDVLGDGMDRFQLAMPRQDRRVYAVSYKGDQLTPTLATLSTQVYQQRRNRDFSQVMQINQANFAGPGSKLTLDFDLDTVYEQTTTGMLSSVEWLPASGHRVVGGVDLVRDEMDATVSDVTRTTIIMSRLPAPSISTSTENPRNQTRQDSAGVYIQDEWAPHRTLKLIAGVRVSAFDSSLRSTTNTNLQPGSKTRGHMTGTASVVYQPGPAATFRASYSQGYRHPNLLELYEGTAHGGGGLLYPNADLDPEVSDNVEIGARLQGRGLSLDLSAFMTDARHYVATRYCGGDAPCPTGAVTGTDRVYDNVDGARTNGLELAATAKIPGTPVEVFAEATWLRRRFEHTTWSTWNTGMPNIWGRAGLRTEVGLGHGLRGFGEVALRAASDTTESLSATEDVTFAGWAATNLRLGVDLGRTTAHMVVIEVGNLFDRAYRPAQESLYQPGRHIIAKVVTGF